MQSETILVIASRNHAKTTEIVDLLKDYPVTIKNLDDFGPIPEVIEDGLTFEENAYKKASFTARVLGYPAAQAQKALSGITAKLTENADTEMWIKTALLELAG